MLKVTYSVIVESNSYFDSSFGNFLPSEEFEIQEAYVNDMAEFENKYPYYEEIIRVENFINKCSLL